MKAAQTHIVKETEKLAVPRVLPRIHPRIRSLLADEKQIFNLVEQFGSPLNLVFPQNIHDNIRDFQDVYKRYRMRGRIYFSSKPCKSLALYREAAGTDIGIDVSSSSSLKTVMDCGWSADRIGATGPKNKNYLSEALKSGTLINIDNLDELKQAASLHRSLGLDKKSRITLRCADNGKDKIQFVNEKDSTFGIRTQDMDAALSIIKENKDILTFTGFTWHSSTARDEQRIAAMDNLLQLTYAAIRKGFSPTTINIGGGFPIMYADSCQQWADYTLALKSAVLGNIPPQTWNRTGLGFRMENGVLAGGPMFMDHAPYDARGEELEKRLEFKMPSFGGTRFSDIVRDSLLSLSIEPGTGMLDQCGVTLGSVSFVKPSAQGETLVGLEMNRSNLHADQHKILTEPVVLPRDRNQINDNDMGVYYVGNLCLSYDMLQYNKTYPATMPQTGDVVAFMNTAPYRMDFTESETLMQPVAEKIALTEQDGQWHWVKDADYRRTL